MTNKSIKIWAIISVFLLMLFLSFVAVLYKKNFAPDSRVEGCPINASCSDILAERLEHYFATMRTSIVRILVENHAAPSSLDFTKPEENGYGDNAVFEVFNDGGSLMRYWDVLSDRWLVDSHVSYTFGNRIYTDHSSDSKETDLLAIVTDIPQHACAYLYKDFLIPEIPKLNILNFPEGFEPDELITLPKGQPYDHKGCVKSNGRLYYYHLLVPVD